MKRFNLVLFALLMFVSAAYAQRTVSGQVTDEGLDGEPMIGVNVVVKGSNPLIGTITDFDGNYSIEVPEKYTTLVFTYAGYSAVEEEISGTTVNVGMSEGVDLQQTVVTAIGISREKKSLGYATQEVSGEELEKAREVNIVNSLQGKVAGVQISGSSNIGGSSRIIIRGASSVTGNNNALFVVDGIPMDNSNFTSTNQARGAGGYDYGNAIQDLNPDDIASVNVLKGAAATALYGERGANGVIVITTKNGSSMGKKNSLGVTVNSSVQFNQVSYLPTYQNKYGGGGSDQFSRSTIDTNQFVADMATDGSWGAKFDGQQVRQWDSYDDWDTENFGKTREWKAAEGNVKDFFRTGITTTNGVSVGGANENGSFRTSFTNTYVKGTQVNSDLMRNNIAFKGAYNLTDNFRVSTSTNYVSTSGKNRPLTGYGESVMSQFTQWYQRQLSTDRLRNYKNPDGTQRTWNRLSETDPNPNYFDNPFWERYENGQRDKRDRGFGNIAVNYKITDYLSATATAMTDFYTDRREEWVAVGGVRQASYSEDVRFLQENNFEGRLNFNKRVAEDFSVSAMLGTNYRTRKYERNYTSTQGGLNVANLYNLSNSASELVADDFRSRLDVFSVFAQASVGYKDYLYLDLTGRMDINSTLPSDNNEYFYPSASLSFVFSELIPQNDILSFGKFRANYAVVGRGASPYRLYDTYIANSNFGANGTATVPNSANNPNLRPELSSSMEFGLDLKFLKDRLGIDVGYYNTTTKDQIFNAAQSGATGYTSSFINAGKIRNQGIEIAAYGTPVKTKDLRWDIGFNFAKNTNEVLELNDGAENLRLTSLFGVALEARVGQPLGTLMGTNYVFDANGNKVVGSDGYYLVSDEVEALGSVLADFTGGVNTSVSYKGLSLYLLVDFQKGGRVMSFSNTWGKYSGVLAETAEGDIRENGTVVEGKKATYDANGDLVYDANGKVVTDGDNDVNIDTRTHFFYNQGYVINAADVYDASFVKLREARLSYTFPTKWFESTPFQSLSLSVVGRNLAILHRNAPNIDPETGGTNSAGNFQGFEGGALPTERSIGINLNVKF